MNTKSFKAKILLFGEYTIINGSHALAIPIPQFKGKWAYTKDKQINILRSDLGKFADYLDELSRIGDILLDLDVQKFKNKRINLILTFDPINKVIEEALEQVSFLIEQKSLKLELQLGDSLSSQYDYKLISRVIINIMTNAIKNTPANGSIHIKTDFAVFVGQYL